MILTNRPDQENMDLDFDDLSIPEKKQKEKTEKEIGRVTSNMTLQLTICLLLTNTIYQQDIKLGISGITT